MSEVVKVEVKTSSIPNAGKGVFVIEDCKKGDDLMFYDGYKSDKEHLTIFEHEYCLNINNSKMIGHRNPRCARGVAQIINDYSYPQLDYNFNGDLFTRVNMIIVEFHKYHIQSFSKANISHRDSVTFYLYKDIKKGEECFINYGIEYWVDWHMYKIRNPNLYHALIVFEYLYF
jgi:hypothetical protein